MSREIVFAFKADSSQFRQSITAMSTGFLAVQKAASMVTQTVGKLGSGIASAVGNFGAFQKANLSLRSVLEMNAADTKKMADELQMVGIKTQFTTEQIQKAAISLGQMGTTKKEMIPLIKAVADLATATDTRLEPAAAIFKQAMNQWGLSVKDTTRLMTVFVQSHTASGATVLDLAQSMKAAAPVASTFGQKLEDVVPIMMLLRDAGQEAGTIGKVIRKSFTSLVGPTKEAGKILSELEDKVGSLDPRTQPLVNVLEKLGQAGATDTQIFKVFGAEFGPTILKLMKFEKAGKTGFQVLGNYRKVLGDTAAAAKKVELKQTGLSFAADQAAASFEAVKVKLGEFIAKAFDAEGVFVKISAGLGSIAKTMGGIDFGKLSFDKMFSGEAIGKAFTFAIDTAFPFLGKAVAGAFVIGVRQFVRLVPIASAAFAKASIKFLGGGLIRVAQGMAQTIVGAIGSVMEQMMVALGRGIAKLGLTDTGNSIALAGAGVGDFAKNWSKSIGKGGDAAVEWLDKAAAMIDVKMVGKGSDIMVDELFGKFGTLGGVVEDVTTSLKGWMASVKAGQQAEARAKAEATAREAQLAREEAKRRADRIRTVVTARESFRKQSAEVVTLTKAAAVARDRHENAPEGTTDSRYQKLYWQRSSAAGSENAARAEAARLKAAYDKLLNELPAKIAAAVKEGQPAQQIIERQQVIGQQTNYGDRNRESVKGPRKTVPAGGGGGTQSGGAR